MEVTAGVCVALGAPLGLLYLVKRYISGARCTSQARLDGKTVIITGANTGIGKETAIDLARCGSLAHQKSKCPTLGNEVINDVFAFP